MSVDKTKLIERWIKDVHDNMGTLKPAEIENIIFQINNIKLENNACTDYDEKENETDKQTTSKLVGNMTEKLTMEKVDEILEDNSIDERIENSIKFDANNKELGKTEFWKFNDDDNKIEKRLQPQQFHHHECNPSIFKNDKGEYFYYKNKNCPDSGTEQEMKNNGLMKSDRLKKSAYCYKIKRVSRYADEKIEYLCRLCPFVKWIPVSKFGDHMGLAHGIIRSDNVGIVALPPPVALYKQNIGRLKFYYSKCPKCLKWIRLGKMSDVQNICEDVSYIDQLNSNSQIVGLYTNYFYHFLGCSVDPLL